MCVAQSRCSQVGIPNCSLIISFLSRSVVLTQLPLTVLSTQFDHLVDFVIRKSRLVLLLEWLDKRYLLIEVVYTLQLGRVSLRPQGSDGPRKGKRKKKGNWVNEKKRVDLDKLILITIFTAQTPTVSINTYRERKEWNIVNVYTESECG